MKDRYGATTERAWWMRTHVQAASYSLTAQPPLNNIVRMAYQAMAGMLGDCQSLHTDSMDETLGLPTETAVRVAMRAQQILAHETGVHRTVDPLGGFFYVEALRDQMDADASEILPSPPGYHPRPRGMKCPISQPAQGRSLGFNGPAKRADQCSSWSIRLTQRAKRASNAPLPPTPLPGGPTQPHLESNVLLVSPKRSKPRLRIDRKLQRKKITTILSNKDDELLTRKCNRQVEQLSSFLNPHPKFYGNKSG